MANQVFVVGKGSSTVPRLFSKTQGENQCVMGMPGDEERGGVGHA